MFSALSALGSIASLFKFLFNWLRENQIFNAGRKEQQRVELQETFNRLKQLREYDCFLIYFIISKSLILSVTLDC